MNFWRGLTADGWAERDDADQHHPACIACGDRGITLRGESTYERCACAAGQALVRRWQPGRSAE